MVVIFHLRNSSGTVASRPPVTTSRSDETDRTSAKEERLCCCRLTWLAPDPDGAELPARYHRLSEPDIRRLFRKL